MVALKQLFTILVKNEVTPGVDPTPTPGANAVLVKDLQIKPMSDLLIRNMNNPSFSQFPHVVGGKWYEASFKTELKGSGTAQAGGASDVPEIDPLLRALGFAVTLTAETIGGAGDGMIEYDPASTGLESATLYAYEDGLLKKLHYCRVNSFRLNAEAGKFGEIEVSMIGLYTTPTDAAIPGGMAFNATKPAPFINAQLAIDGYNPVFNKLSVDMGVVVAKRLDANSAQSIKGFEITGRTVTGSVDPEQVTEATHPFYGNWETGNEMAFTGQFGSVAGNIVVVTAPKCQYREITPGDREGIAVYEVPLTFARQNGDDEFKLTFK